MYNKNNKKGFTLVEALLTLIIIGVITAIILPPFYNNFRKRKYESTRKVFIANLKSAVRNMQADDNYAGFKNTEAFVRNLAKYMKIVKICDYNNMGECFIDEFVEGEGMASLEECSSGPGYCYTYAQYDYSTATTHYTYSFRDSSFFEKKYRSYNVGIVTANGVNAVLTYDPNCSSSDEMFSDKNALSCISAIFDVNGFKEPNNTLEDIGYLNFTPERWQRPEYTCKGTMINNVCWLLDDIASGATSSVYGMSSSSEGADYRLPTVKELKDLMAQKGSDYSNDQCFQSNIRNDVTYQDYSVFNENPHDYYLFVKPDGTVLPNGNGCTKAHIFISSEQE